VEVNPEPLGQIAVCASSRNIIIRSASRSAALILPLNENQEGFASRTGPCPGRLARYGRPGAFSSLLISPGIPRFLSGATLASVCSVQTLRTRKQIKPGSLDIPFRIRGHFRLSSSEGSGSSTFSSVNPDVTIAFIISSNGLPKNGTTTGLPKLVQVHSTASVAK
jgi:hypothetical protein